MVGRNVPALSWGDVYGNRPVVGINSLRVGAVAIIVNPSSSFSFAITGLIAEVSIHLSIQTSGDRGLQHTSNQVIGIRCGRA